MVSAGAGTTDVATAEAVGAAFRQLVGSDPAGVWAAPGRVNLIGEHTDYNDGFVLPFALEQQVVVAAAPRTDGTWRVRSLNRRQTESFGPDDLVPGRVEGWAAYVAGVVWALVEAGHTVEGADLVLGSDVPSGAGLSSSAALECAVLTTLVDLSGLEVAPLDRARLARRCENEYVGAPTGLLDQAASTLCEADNALFLDCRSADTRQVPLDLADAGLELLVLDTKTPHSHVTGEYGDRRRSCEEAAAVLGVPALRDVPVDELDAALERLPDDEMRRRVRHVVTEDARVLEAVAVADAGRPADLAPLLDASHVSMRDDFEITVPTVDLAVETARKAGAHGARMTGGGFGGCIIALVPAGRSDEVGEAVAAAFAEAGHGAPAWFVGRPSAGARRLS
ncbi:galactokinase [Microlunatus sagamiharensis]|uniref:Galactokinase n=1 Tax=Microlunatus sagamiharensis TaxID=546874 RepID=A0A1H2MC94_9ACTN|nr:galactokinase [Microlunatus sagamiharensis]SDU90086.1 galactokinase [Microlunatus sagamiharensis]